MNGLTFFYSACLQPVSSSAAVVPASPRRLTSTAAGAIVWTGQDRSFFTHLLQINFQYILTLGCAQKLHFILLSEISSYSDHLFFESAY